MTIERLALRAMAGLAAALVVTVALAATSHATDGPHRAGLIIVHAGGQMTGRCVAFSETAISGLELLERSGLDLNVDATSGVGVAVCRIDNEGCGFPAQACFCECQGATCIYWSYWHLASGGAWRYANLGASSVMLGDGDVDAWIWGPGSNTAGLLPSVSFDQICAAPTSMATATAAPTATATPPPPTATAAPPARVLLPPTAAADPPTESPPATATGLPPVSATAPPAIATSAPPSAPFAGTAASSVPVPPAPALQPMTPVIATPTRPPAPTAPPPAARPRPASTGATSARPGAPGSLSGIASTSTPAAVAQVNPSVTPRPSRTPPPILGAVPGATATPPSRDAASTVPPPGFLPVSGVILAGAGACGGVLLLVRRPK